MFLGLFIYSLIQIVTYSDYDIEEHNIFYDVNDMDPIDFSEYVSDFVFGFLHNG